MHLNCAIVVILWALQCFVFFLRLKSKKIYKIEVFRTSKVVKYRQTCLVGNPRDQILVWELSKRTNEMIRPWSCQISRSSGNPRDFYLCPLSRVLLISGFFYSCLFLTPYSVPQGEITSIIYSNPLSFSLSELEFGTKDANARGNDDYFIFISSSVINLFGCGFTCQLGHWTFRTLHTCFYWSLKFYYSKIFVIFIPLELNLRLQFFTFINILYLTLITLSKNKIIIH